MSTTQAIKQWQSLLSNKQAPELHKRPSLFLFLAWFGFIAVLFWAVRHFSLSQIFSDKKTPQSETGVFWYKSLTMTYFHMGIHTIIGAKSFHCPVRDGKEWDQLAMVVKQSL